jgi:uncharacterized protein (TIGR02452 family)
MSHHEPWKPYKFLDDFDIPAYRHAKRRKVYEYTLRAIRHGKYTIEDEFGKKESQPLLLGDVQGSTVFYDSLNKPETAPDSPRYPSTRIEVLDSDCIDAAKHMLDEEGIRPIVLNMASYMNPGGGVVHGSGAQEENLFRRTDYCRSLYQFRDFPTDQSALGVVRNAAHSYPLDKLDGAIYSPGITVFRGNEAQGYPFLKQPFALDFVAVAAMNFYGSTAPHVYTPEEERITRHKIRLLLRICQSTGHTHLVLSALGCGAFCNPPHDVARFFREALDSDEFRGAFLHIVFAILDDGTPKGNYPVFKEVMAQHTL